MSQKVTTFKPDKGQTEGKKKEGEPKSELHK